MDWKKGKIDAVGYISFFQPHNTLSYLITVIYVYEKGKYTWWYLLEIKKMMQDPEGWPPKKILYLVSSKFTISSPFLYRLIALKTHLKLDKYCRPQHKYLSLDTFKAVLRDPLLM